MQDYLSDFPNVRKLYSIWNNLSASFNIPTTKKTWSQSYNILALFRFQDIGRHSETKKYSQHQSNLNREKDQCFFPFPVPNCRPWQSYQPAGVGAQSRCKLPPEKRPSFARHRPTELLRRPRYTRQCLEGGLIWSYLNSISIPLLTWGMMNWGCQENIVCPGVLIQNIVAQISNK